MLGSGWLRMGGCTEWVALYIGKWQNGWLSRRVGG
jgi:hypothetical protein